MNYTNFTHFGHEFVKQMDFGSVSLNFAGIFTFGKGWSIRPSLGILPICLLKTACRDNIAKFPQYFLSAKAFLGEVLVHLSTIRATV